MHTMDDFSFTSKTVLVRVDINSPVKDSIVQDNPRLKEHSKTIKELSEKGAKVVVLAHQGRPGDKDFVHTDQHAKILEKHIGKKVTFVNDLYGDLAFVKIKAMKNGDIILLDNVRMFDDELLKKKPEMLAKTKFVKVLSKISDYYINDAFSVSHRESTSLVGFPFVMTSCIGRVMEKELEALKNIKEKKPAVLIIGGVKPEEKIGSVSKKFDYILTGGLQAEIFLKAKGKNLGKSEEFLSASIIPIAKKKLKFNVVLPDDFVLEDKEIIKTEKLPSDKIIKDIGPATIEKYKKIISKAKTIVMDGTLGICEEGFDNGTKEILKAISESNAFSLMGGGHTTEYIDEMKIADKFSYISIAGGALLEFLSGKKFTALKLIK
jgi:phosphoglycerate kinase